MYKRVDLTKEASVLIATLKEKYGDLMFHQSGGCCDGSQPMCFEKGDFKIGGSDIKIGTIDDCEFFMAKDQYEYWKHTHLTIDVIPGRGSSFSLEIPLGFRFIVNSRLFTEAELQDLQPIVYFD